MFIHEYGTYVENCRGETRYYKHGRLHREDGSAVIIYHMYGGTSCFYYLDGKAYSHLAYKQARNRLLI